MRISDWSSDVCSSDLHAEVEEGRARQMHVADPRQVRVHGVAGQEREAEEHRAEAGDRGQQQADGDPARRSYRTTSLDTARARKDRQSHVSGKSGSVRVDCGGRRSIKKKKKKQSKYQ